MQGFWLHVPHRSRSMFAVPPDVETKLPRDFIVAGQRVYPNQTRLTSGIPIYFFSP
jgi:hypothetical protein